VTWFIVGAVRWDTGDEDVTIQDIIAALIDEP
jgi:hypothetical protein